MRNAGGASETPALIVVRAGALDRFATLQTAFEFDGIDVVWDRRLGDRRRAGADSPAAPERRRRERRGPSPTSWVLLDFLIVPGHPLAS